MKQTFLYTACQQSLIQPKTAICIKNLKASHILGASGNKIMLQKQWKKLLTMTISINPSIDP